MFDTILIHHRGGSLKHVTHDMVNVDSNPQQPSSFSQWVVCCLHRRLTSLTSSPHALTCPLSPRSAIIVEAFYTGFTRKD